MKPGKFANWYLTFGFVLILIIGIGIINQLPKDYYATGAILLSAILAFVAAVTNISYQRRTARESNALSFQQKLLDNKEYMNNSALVSRAIANRLDFPLKNYAKPEHKYKEEAKAIRYVLNTWERAANAIKHDIYDDNYLYEAYKSYVIKLHVYFFDYIKVKQNEQNSLYERFVWLATQWRTKRDTEFHRK